MIHFVISFIKKYFYKVSLFLICTVIIWIIDISVLRFLLSALLNTQERKSKTSYTRSIRRMHIPMYMRINSFRTLRRAGCRGTRMGINQVPIDFEPYNLFPSPLPLSACYYGNIEDATAAFLARFATKGVDFRFYRPLRCIRANLATLNLETLR